MSEDDLPDAPDPEAPDPEAQSPEAPYPGKGPPTSHEPFVPAGTESTRELREMARRRREAEEKLQQHLLEAKEKPAEH